VLEEVFKFGLRNRDCERAWPLAGSYEFVFIGPAVAELVVKCWTNSGRLAGRRSFWFGRSSRTGACHTAAARRRDTFGNTRDGRAPWSFFLRIIRLDRDIRSRFYKNLKFF
jgi:hypothetical protein